ncbi:SpoIIAA family protein [Planctomicrobium piriforme]|uniref:SpoIIAA-like n=1 Tax=Planctomicrobium piriforme TaxID=1576369 RepID=A0A1I3HVL9_9PLAN|nr:STAS/SEC14 domain-containing protein [Planctomicrobium piriforme]SFI39765.1 SpoIIAA-like [Planctomicrobium piriforme]
MSVEVKEGVAGKFLEVHLTGKLTKEDYQHFVPLIEQRLKDKGKVRLLVELHDFHGWTAGALWEDMKFDSKHFKDIERLAIVGESKWEQGMATFCKPFTTAKIKYFDKSEAAAATTWIQE